MRLAPAACVMLSACGPLEQRAFELPVPAARSVLAVLEDSSKMQSLIAERADVPLRFGAAAGSRSIHLASYDRSLEELGLSRGAVSAAECRSCALLSPLAVHRVSIEEPLGMEVAGPLADTALDVLIPDRHGRCGPACTSFESETLTLDSTVAVAWLVARPNDVVLAGQADGRVIEVDIHTRAIRPWCRLDPLPFAFVEGGDLWIGGTGVFARFSTGAPAGDAPCALERLPPPPGEPYRAAIDRSDGSTVAFALVKTGELYRFARGAWSEVFEFQGDDQLFRGDIVITGPGEAAVVAGLAELARVRGDVATHEPIRLQDMQAAQADAAIWSPELGLVLALDHHGLAVESAGRWEVIESETGWAEVRRILPYRDRFLVTTMGYLHEYGRSIGSCSQVPTGGNGTVHAIATLGDGRVIFAPRTEDIELRPRELVLFRPRVPACGS